MTDYQPNMVLATKTFNVVGTRPIRHDGADKVTGAAKYGADYNPAVLDEVRIRQLEETIEIVKLLWTTSPASYAGRHYRIDNAYCHPQPDPLPPVMVGGGGEQLTLRVVAKHADWWNMPGGTPQAFAHKLGVLREHCAAVGRDFEAIRKTISLSTIAIHHSEAEARLQGQATPYAQNRVSLAGTPDQMAALLQEYFDVGVELFQIRIADFPQTAGMELFIQEVLPRFTG